VLLLHAWVESSACFDRLLQVVPPTLRVFAMDQRGHGDADKPADGYALVNFADDIEAFMDAVGLPSAVLLGSSSGGYVAQQVAVQVPYRVDGPGPRRRTAQPSGPARLCRRGGSAHRPCRSQLGRRVTDLVSPLSRRARLVHQAPDTRRSARARTRLDGWPCGTHDRRPAIRVRNDHRAHRDHLG
jgi:pimeloyl-ACP methyl ester carboxylesterase